MEYTDIRSSIAQFCLFNDIISLSNLSKDWNATFKSKDFISSIREIWTVANDDRGPISSVIEKRSLSGLPSEEKMYSFTRATSGAVYTYYVHRSTRMPHSDVIFRHDEEKTTSFNLRTYNGYYIVRCGQHTAYVSRDDIFKYMRGDRFHQYSAATPSFSNTLLGRFKVGSITIVRRMSTMIVYNEFTEILLTIAVGRDVHVPRFRSVEELMRSRVEHSLRCRYREEGLSIGTEDGMYVIRSGEYKNTKFKDNRTITGCIGLFSPDTCTISLLPGWS